MTAIKSPKKLIEVALPLDDINRKADRMMLFARLADTPSRLSNKECKHGWLGEYGTC